MSVIVLQPHGLGDLIFCQSLVHQIADRQEIVWPVLPHFLPGLRVAYPNINWLPIGTLGNIENIRRDSIINGKRVIPIRWADSITNVKYKDCMRSKYEMYGLDWRSWKYFGYKRNQENERNLFFNVLGLLKGAKFRLINDRFTSLETKKVHIPESPDLVNVYMKSIPGFSLFDWSLVIEKATEIHTVGTSINYIIELLDIQAKEVVLYKRLPDENHYENYDYILEKHSYIYT
jgi:hypothetical protein